MPTTSRPAGLDPRVRSELRRALVLPFLSLFLRSVRAVGDRDEEPDHYELEADYANYLQSLGAPNRLVRGYAYKNARLPQCPVLALALGAVVGGALVTEIVFGYPGVGSLILTSIQSATTSSSGASSSHHHRRSIATSSSTSPT